MKIAAFIQQILAIRPVLVLAIALTFGACKPDEDPQPENGFSTEIRNNIPQTTINKVRQLGVRVNEGTKPPFLEGTYWLAPLIMTNTDVPDDYYEVGDQFNDYKIQLYDQDTRKLTISLNSKSYNSYGEEASHSVGQDGAYISGAGNYFTIFIITESTHTSNGSRSKMLEVYSGEMTSTGIKNLQNAILMMDDYGDVNDDLIPVNTGRAFEDGDYFSEPAGAFRKASSAQRTAGAKMANKEQAAPEK